MKCEKEKYDVYTAHGNHVHSMLAKSIHQEY